MFNKSLLYLKRLIDFVYRGLKNEKGGHLDRFVTKRPFTGMILVHFN